MYTLYMMSEDKKSFPILCKILREIEDEHEKNASLVIVDSLYVSNTLEEIKKSKEEVLVDKTDVLFTTDDELGKAWSVSGGKTIFLNHLCGVSYFNQEKIVLLENPIDSKDSKSIEYKREDIKKLLSKVLHF